MDTQESTKENILSNEIALSKAGINTALKIYNNLDKLMEEIYFGSCGGDVTCAGTFALCFYAESTILECDKDKKASDRVF